MNDAIDRIAAAMPLVLTGVVVAAALLAIVLVVRVVRKAGYSPWWAVGVFVPGVNLVLLVMFATVRWPLERRLEEAERRLTHASHLGGLTSFAAAAPPTPSGAHQAVTPPTFTALPYPVGYGPPPSPVSGGQGEPADSRPDSGA